MAFYNLYAGIINGFNSPVDYRGTWEFETAAEAKEAAREIAIEIYHNYEGNSGYDLMSWEDCKKDLESGGYKAYKEDIDRYYEDEVNKWIDYCAVLAVYDPKNPL